jgi:DNA-binding LacI/PurR family transcriptional regulator
VTETRLKDVAARAGVSTATVSRVIHQNGYVSAEARERVEAAIRESGYRLNAVAQGLCRQRTMTLGHILHETVPNPFFAEIAMGVEHAAAERGFNVLIFNARNDPARERRGVEILLARRVDGIIFSTHLDEANVRAALEAGVPVVEVEKPLCADASSVVADNYSGAMQAMQHLLDLGHRRIGYLGEPYKGHPGAVARVIRERFDAYRAALRSVDEDVNEAHVVLETYWRDPGWEELRTGADYMERLLAQTPNLTAVFATSDLLAAGALQTLYARGIRIPEEMSVIGFDDTFARHLAPPLTTVQQPMFEMGSRAAAIAIGAGAHTEPTTEWCSTSLIVRASTSAPKSRRAPTKKQVVDG